MVKIEQLTGIPESKRREVVEVLDDLIAYKTPDNKAVISGYNWYDSASQSDSRVTFSNIHENDRYKIRMIRDLVMLGYRRKYLLERMREKGGVFFWNPEYNTLDDDGNVLSGLKIKDLRTGKPLDLGKYTKPLEEYEGFKDSNGFLIAEDYGWEVDIPFRKREKLMKLVDLFLRKSGSVIFD